MRTGIAGAERIPIEECVSPFCGVCGDRLVPIEGPGGYDVRTGEPYDVIHHICPRIAYAGLLKRLWRHVRGHTVHNSLADFQTDV